MQIEAAVAVPMNPVAPIESSDGDLVRRAQSGDRKAFGELLERYMRRAYYSALGLVGSAEDARDLSQEAFVRAFRARQTIDPERPFFAWLYQIIRRLCFNHTRDRRTRLRGIDAAQNWLVDQAETRHSGANPDRALETLSEKDREVLVMKEFEGLRYREIAALLDIPIGTVMSRLYSARRRLAASLEEIK
jgi:RNA polymerase sigma-70 factor (ECF subfamily)